MNIYKSFFRYAVNLAYARDKLKALIKKLVYGWFGFGIQPSRAEKLRNAAVEKEDDARFKVFIVRCLLPVLYDPHEVLIKSKFKQKQKNVILISF